MNSAGSEERPEGLEPELKQNMKTLRFQNPANQYVETIHRPALGTLLAGPLYIGLQGAWGPAVGYFILTFFTFGLSWLFLPFWATSIIRRHYLSRGWVELDPPTTKETPQQQKIAAMELELVKLKSGVKSPAKPAARDDDGEIPTYSLD